MAQGSWKSGSVAHYGSTTDTPASLLPGKRLGEPVVARSTVPQTEAYAVYPQDPPSSYIVEDPAGSARLHAPEPEGKGTMHGCTVGTTPHGLSQMGSIHFFTTCTRSLVSPATLHGTGLASDRNRRRPNPHATVKSAFDILVVNCGYKRSSFF